MDSFEEDLKKALERTDPPPDFAQRVLAKCVQEDQKKTRGAWRSMLTAPAWRIGLVAAATLLLVGGGTAYQQHERAVEGQAAKRKLLLAMRIAGTKMQEVRQRVVDNAEAEQ